MSQVETAVGGNPLRTINAAAQAEPYQLPAGFAPGRTVTIRREDSGITGYAVTVTVPTGNTLDGVLNASVRVPGDTEVVFRAINPGIWETYGLTGAANPSPGSDGWLKVWASNLDALIGGTIARDSNGAATSASVTWPDGTTGTYTATTVSTAFPGAVDAYAVTYNGITTKTVTQSAVTRDATSGAVINRPTMTVS